MHRKKLHFLLLCYYFNKKNRKASTSDIKYIFDEQNIFNT